MADTDSEAFAAYVAKVEQYARTWPVRSPLAESALAGRPGRRAELARKRWRQHAITTFDVYHDDDGWLADRQVLHGEVLDLLSPAPMTERDRLRIVVLLLGLPGSGKSTALKPIARRCLDAMGQQGDETIDADAIRIELPEYADGLGSGVVQVETADLTYGQLVPRARLHRSNLIFDTVGNPDETVASVRRLVDDGWDVVCLTGAVDVEIAVERAMRRALENRRYVPVPYIRAVGDRPRQTYDALAGSGIDLVGRALFDLNGAVGAPPIVLDTDQPDLFGEIGRPTSLVGGAV